MRGHREIEVIRGIKHSRHWLGSKPNTLLAVALSWSHHLGSRAGVQAGRLCFSETGRLLKQGGMQNTVMMKKVLMAWLRPQVLDKARHSICMQNPNISSPSATLRGRNGEERCKAVCAHPCCIWAD